MAGQHSPSSSCPLEPGSERSGGAQPADSSIGEQMCLLGPRILRDARGVQSSPRSSAQNAKFMTANRARSRFPHPRRGCEGLVTLQGRRGLTGRGVLAFLGKDGTSNAGTRFIKMNQRHVRFRKSGFSNAQRKPPSTHSRISK